MASPRLKKAKLAHSGGGSGGGSAGASHAQRGAVEFRLSGVHVTAGTAQRALKGEDRVDVRCLPKGGALYVGVYDGHGGAGAAQYVQENFLSTLVGELGSSAEWPARHAADALVRAYERTDIQMREDMMGKVSAHAEENREVRCADVQGHHREVPCRCLVSKGHGLTRAANEGCAAVSVMLLPKGELVCANAGDSVALVVRKEGPAVLLSADHSPVLDPDNADYARVVAAGASVRDAPGVTLADVNAGGAVKPVPYVRAPGAHSLNMTRAFGNFGLKGAGPASALVVTPAVNVLPYDPSVLACVVASDGLSDNVSRARIADVVRSSANADGAARRLVGEAATADVKPDDTSCCVMMFAQEHVPDVCSSLAGGNER